MHWIDALIVLVPLALVMYLAFRSKRYARGVVDYLAAGRVGGRYVIGVGNLASALSVITLVAGAEQQFETGFGVGWWNNIGAPLGIVLGLTGYCAVRWRQSRCLSKGQFIELRYGSKVFRFVTGLISTLAEMVTNSIGPAVAANFFIYYLGLPHKIMLFGVPLPCYIILVALSLIVATLIIWPGGRVSLLITDSIQALLSYPIFVIIVGFILLNFGWNTDISPVLWNRVPKESFLNPYDVQNFRDFNVFAIMVSLFMNMFNVPAFYGNDTTNSGRTPHEQKMAGVIGAWRNGYAFLMITMVAIITVVFMNGPQFAGKNRFDVSNNEIRRELAQRVLTDANLKMDEGVRARALQAMAEMPDIQRVPGVDPPLSQDDNLNTVYFDRARQELGETPEGREQFQKFRALYRQQMMPVMMGKLLPVGMFGLFALLMVMLLVSTDDTRIFNAAGCIVQDIVLPFLKKGSLSPQAHLKLLRFVTLGVSIFFFVVAFFFKQMDYINMFTQIMTGFWLASAGPIMVFGLYTRFGNLAGGWCALIFGSGTTLLGMLGQRNWAKHIYPFLESHGWVDGLDRFLRAVSSPFHPWIKWKADSVNFPINSYELLFIATFLAIASYIIASFIRYKPYDLDKLLHRGKYAPPEEQARLAAAASAARRTPRWMLPLVWCKMLLGIDPNYTRGDKIIAWSVFLYSFVYAFLLAFVGVCAWNAIRPWTQEGWNTFFFYNELVIPAILGIVSTVWMGIGGFMDMKALFRDLAKRVDDPEDNGMV